MQLAKHAAVLIFGTVFAILIGATVVAQEAPALSVLDRSDGPVQINIERIVKDSRISGQATGLAPGERDKYKVIVLVHTDRWYLHPYAGQGRGKSWATIDGDGRWSIPSVKRQFVADQVAAVLVAQGLAEPASVERILEIESSAWVIVQGTGDV